MAKNTKLAQEQWDRYTYVRDMGHLAFVAKADKCSSFVAGEQWDPAILAKLKSQRRPGLTLNKTFITLQSVLGEQIDTRSEIAFRARYGAPSGNAETLTKLFRYISDNQQLNWKRTDVFCDGAITGRGYYDVRMDFAKNVTGDIVITTLNPKNVMPDPDASSYDPDEWADVMVTTWMSPDEIALMFNEEDAKLLSVRSQNDFSFGYDSLDEARDRFGGRIVVPADSSAREKENANRSIRVIDRQHRMLSKVKFFVNPRTGDKQEIPTGWTDEQIGVAAQTSGLLVSEERVRRVRWTVTADDIVLHDDWSPYKRFTIVPYFPYFKYGRTVGLVEGLLDPQELLNKTTSQELHVVNTMANSGWKVKSGALVNMDIEELEDRGAETGLVLEVNGDPDKDAVKIQPNQIPQGLDRLSFKAESYIKAISGRGDNQLGLTRPDQSGKLAEEANKSSDATLRLSFDSLERTDFLLARTILTYIQTYYTDPRIMHVTHSNLTGEQDTISINTPDPEDNTKILNDLSLGEYDIVVVSSPAKRSQDDAQLELLIAMKEKLGMQIPEEFFIENSNLLNKAALIKAMKAAAESPQALMQQQIQLLTQQLEVANLRADASKSEAEAVHSRAKTQESLASAALKTKEAEGGNNEMELEAQRHEQEMQMMREKHEMEMAIKRESSQVDLQLKKMEGVENIRLKKAQAIAAARAKPVQAPAGQPAASAAK